MICQFSGNGVSQEGLQQKRGRERSLRCTENRAACTVFWAVEDTAAQPAINVPATPVSFQGAWEKNYPCRQAIQPLDASTS